MNTKMDEKALSNRDIGQLLEAKGAELKNADPEDANQLLREIMDTLGRSEQVRRREKRVNRDGRISFGRDLAGESGVGLFLAEGDDDE